MNPVIRPHVYFMGTIGVIMAIGMCISAYLEKTQPKADPAALHLVEEALQRMIQKAVRIELNRTFIVLPDGSKVYLQTEDAKR